MLNHLDPASALAFGLLVFSLVMVIMFEATNGFHDAANDLGRGTALWDDFTHRHRLGADLPVTILVSGGLYYILASPKF